jgi:two-component system invasion response regulator UvrY
LIRILLAIDCPIFHQGIKTVIEEAGDMAVVAVAATCEAALQGARASAPDVVVLDLALPGRGGLEAIHDLKRLIPGPRLLVLSMLAEDRYAVRSLREGADGYLAKDAEVALLPAAIRRVHAGGKYVSPSLAEALAICLEDGPGGSAMEILSVRELQILRLVGMGATVREIAGRLHLSSKTVSSYRSRIRDKMSLTNTTQLIRYAIQSGLA